MVELNGKSSNDLVKSFQRTQLIVLIQLFSTVLLIIFGWFLSSKTDNSVTEKAVSLLWVTIILLLILSFVLRRVLFSWRYLQKNAQQKGKEGLLVVLQNNTVFLGLIGVIIAVIGFLVATVSGNKFEILRAGIIAIVVFLFNFPRLIIWQKILAGINES